MSYDRIWLCPSLKREDWVEYRSRSRRLISNDETFSKEAIEKEERGYGNFKVSLAMGENMLVDKLYQFLCEADARRFFEGGPLAPGEHSYRDRDYIKEGVGPGSCDMGIGFDHVELYIYGRLIDMHSGGCARRPAQAARSVVLGDVP